MAIRWATGFTNIDNAEAVGEWNGFRHNGGGSPSPGVDTDIFIQGNSALSIKVSGSARDEGFWWDFGSSNEVDFTTAGHFWGWVQVTTISLLSTTENGGIYVVAASDASGNNWSKWYVAGIDTLVGGFIRVVLDLNKTPSEEAATAATISSIRHIGFGINSNGSVKSENLIIDRCDYGDAALQIDNDAVGDITANLQDFFDEDTLDANKYGIIDKRGGIFYLRGGMVFGDSAQSGTTTFDDDTGAVVEFENPQYHNGVALVSSIAAADLYKISAEGAASQNTSVTFGDVVGSGDDRQGIKGGIIRSDGPKFEVDFETDIADLSAVNLYGLIVNGAGLVKLSGSTETDVIGSTFENCDEVQPNDVEFLNNTIIAPIPDRGLEIVSGHNIKNIDFIAGSTADEAFERVWQVDESATPDLFVEMTNEANSAAAGDWVVFPDPDSPNDYAAMGSRRKFSALSFDVGTAGNNGTIVWEYWNGSSWAALSNVIDNTDSLTITGVNTVTFDVPSDWASTNLVDENPLFYVRARLSINYLNPNPIGDKGAIASPVEHSTHSPVSGTFTYDNLKFFGTNTAHVENSANATTEDSYPDSNQDDTQELGNATIVGTSQSITGAGGVMSRARFLLSKTLSPTGTAVAKIYEHSGVFGTSSIPTGAALATSNTFDVSTLTTSLVLVDLEFEDEFTLVNTTKYVLTLEYSGGDATNFVSVGTDTSSPTHGGNFATLTGSTWTAVAGTDAIFFAYTDAIVTVNAINDADPSTDDNTGVPPGATIIVNAKTIEITGVTEGAQCSIVAETGGPEIEGTILMNQAADTEGEATTTYNFSTNQPVILRARSSGTIAAAITDDGGVETDETEVARERATTNDVTLFPTSPVVNVDQYYFGGLTQFDKLTVRVGTAGVGTYVLTWEYWNGAWVTLTTTQADAFKSTGENLIKFSKPGDWATTSVNSQGPFYYVRARWTSGTMTTSPIGDNISMSVTKYFPFDQSDTITSSGLSVKAGWVVDSIAC